jgi:hypothetical protein
MPLIKVNSPVIAVAYISARIHPGLADHPVPGDASLFSSGSVIRFDHTLPDPLRRSTRRDEGC